MAYEKLKEIVCAANKQLQRQKLIIYSWGNVSGIDRDVGVFAIKPSGVAYDDLTPDKIVIMDLEGNKVEGDLKPSSDTPTHAELYRSWPDIGGITHTHSPHATIWAQACKGIPCFGTTHADYYYGEIPCTDMLSLQEIETDYELNTGRVIVRYFQRYEIDPSQMPAVLVANHGPFTWGPNPDKSVESAVVLEQVAFTAMGTLNVNPRQTHIDHVLLDKHYLRKHGKDAYYGQK